MKKLFVVLLCCALLAGCQSSTQYGACIGVGDKEKAGYVYRLSGLNIVMAIIFFETLVVPAVVVLTEIKCPVEKEESNDRQKKTS